MSARFELGRVNVNRGALRRLIEGRNGTRAGNDLDARAARVAREARRLVGKDTLDLMKSIRVERGPGHRDIVAGKIGTRTAAYALVHHEDGVPHIIRPRRARALRFVINGRVIFAASVRHPGHRGTKYLTRALPRARG